MRTLKEYKYDIIKVFVVSITGFIIAKKLDKKFGT